MANNVANNTKCNECNIPTDKRRSLAPCTLDANSPAYKSVEELVYALSLPECRNIALTGIFGSGKSSIIDTYLNQDSASKNVLRISLSNFDDPKGNQSQDNSYENEIEYKLFQHIIYKANAEKTQRSRYKRIHVTNFKKIGEITTSIPIFLLCFIIVFEPKVLQIDSFYKVYHLFFGSWADAVNTISDIVACCVMVIIAYKTIRALILKISNVCINQFRAKGIEINFKEEKSVFNKLLDEILYYFKSGDYELIVFEDLDRISDSKKLFLKLREINILLNESDYYISRKRNIKFIYAIKDDIFQKEVRTKCFDYLIPIIPVINCFNAGKYLLRNYSDELKDIPQNDVKRLGMYISTMRDLTNIMNEYMLYKKTIFKDSMWAKRLLAITIYKNLFPHDYSGIHTKEGCLYSAFENKFVFSVPLTKNKKEAIIQCNKNINKKREDIINYRKTVLDWLMNKEGITDLVINGSSYSLSEVAKTDALFNSFRNDKVERWIMGGDPDGETGDYNYKFNDILLSVDPDCLFYETIGDCETSISRSLEERETLEKEIYNIERKTLCELMKCNDNGNDLKALLKEAVNRDNSDLDEDVIDTLRAMILSGYISEDYTIYISYTYPGSIDEQDFKFQQSVIRNIPLEFNYKLNHIDDFIDNLYSDNFESKSILNFDLLNYLLKNNKAASLDTFIGTARKNLDFVTKYCSVQERNDEFLQHLFNGWNGCVKDIAYLQDNDIRIYMLHLLYRHASVNFQISTEELEFISTQYKFLADDFRNCNLERLNDFFKLHHVVFKNLVDPEETTKPLFDSIIFRNQYEVNFSNLKIIYGTDFNTRSYTSIMSGDERIARYVSQDIVKLVNLFPESDTKENQKAISTLSMNESISDELFESFLSRQIEVLPDFVTVNRDRIPLFFKYDKVSASWGNVKIFFDVSDELSIIQPFIIKHAEELKNKQINETDKRLQLLLFSDNDTLPTNVYKILLPSCENHFEADEIKNLNEERLQCILDANYIEYTHESNELYASKSQELFGTYLIRFYDKYIEDNQFGIKIPNKASIIILKSSLLIFQKKRYIDNKIELYEGENSAVLAGLICINYLDIEIDKNSNIKLIKKALYESKTLISLKQKIDLINHINDKIEYDKETERDLINTLEGDYLKLNNYHKIVRFNYNQENKKLLEYLKNNGHYVNKVIEEKGFIKVTFKKRPSRK